jgi:hypothetical protein
MNTAHLDNNIATQLVYDFHRVNNDSNGNPRYVIHFLALALDYDTALKVARKGGFKVYRGKEFGGGFVIQSYNIESDAEWVIKNTLRDWSE